MRFVIVALALLAFLVVGRAMAAEVLDQQNDLTGSGAADSTSGGFLEVAQTFTVGVSGTLSRIGVQLNWPGFGSAGNVILTVYNTVSGVPNTALGTASLPSSTIPSGGYVFQSFDVSSFAIAVHTGDVFAFGISSSVDSTFFVLSSSDHSVYSGGAAQFRQVNPSGPWSSSSFSHDYGFQTYVLASAAGLPGDFNNNGVVDASDYVVWRGNLGNASEAVLAGNGDGMNGVDQGDYNLWRAHFANTAGSGSALENAAVPEPTCFILVSLSLAVASACGFNRCPAR